MADDQVKYSDLFDAGIISEVQNLTNEITSLKNAIAAAKTEANGLRDNLRGAGTATREQQQQTAADAAAVEALNKQVKDLTDKLAKLEERKKRYSKLTNEETASVEALRQALAGEAQEQIKATQAIDIQSKSYNELYQTYNALKDALNKMTVAERENSAAGKEMVNRAKEIRDTLNNLQQATGNYALNVGNYMSAFNGLQFQTQQLLREIPSAVNIKQFFLAISNNIPMFTDALVRYNKGITEIKVKMAGVQVEIARLNAELATMNTQTAEYEAKLVQINALKKQEIELQKASIGGWKAVLKAVGSWQTLVIVGLMLLQKLPDLIKKISDKWKAAKASLTGYKNEMSAALALTQVMADAVKKVESEVTELNLVIDKLSQINIGTQEWADGIAVVNRITGENLDATTATIESVREITRAYTEQAEQLAINSLLTEKIAASNTNRKLRNQALLTGNMSDLAFILGIDAESDDYKSLSNVFEGVKMRREELFAKFKKDFPYYGNLAIESLVTDAMKKSGNTGDELFRNIIYKHLEVLSEDAIRKLQSEYGIVAPAGGDKEKNNNDNTKDPVSDMLTQTRALQDEIIANIEDEYKRAVEAEEKRHERFIQDREAELALLSEDDPRRAVIQKRIEEEEKTHYENRRKLRSDHMKKMRQQWDQNAKEAEQAEKDDAKTRLKAMADGWQKQRAELVEEGASRRELVEAEVAAEIARLKVILDLNRDINGEMMSDEQRQKVEEWIALLEKIQKTGNYSNIKPGQVAGKGGANISTDKKNWSNIAEVMRDVLDVNITNEQISALNSVFDQAKEALNSWMDARKSAADQAKELADDEVSAAENALNREIELRNQGYANDVALREKELAAAKKAQEEAVAEQKKIAQQQILLDSALQASSMITASANIIKQFPNPAAWIPMLSVMWGAFLWSKGKAYEEAGKAKLYREGGVMLLEGGSHQSGHDVNLGIGPDGSNLRAEGGEYFAVINKRNSRKYSGEIPGIVNALNAGMFEDKYIKTSDAMGLMGRMGVVGNVGESVDLSAVESGVGQLVKQGERSWSTEGEYRVMRYKNLTRRVKVN